MAAGNLLPVFGRSVSAGASVAAESPIGLAPAVVPSPLVEFAVVPDSAALLAPTPPAEPAPGGPPRRDGWAVPEPTPAIEAPPAVAPATPAVDPAATPADDPATAGLTIDPVEAEDAADLTSEASPPVDDADPAAASPATGVPQPSLLLDLPAGIGAPVRVPIIMYHHIGGLPPRPDQLRLNLTLSDDDFAAQLAYLKENGYQTVTLNDVMAAMYGEQELPEKAIVLTFDDGYADHYTNAYRLLAEYGFTGTFFVVTGLVGQDEYVTWDQLREMSAAGMRIEAHGLTHRDLREIGSAGIAEEAAGAKRTLEEEVGQPVRFYGYPSGQYTPATPGILEQAGYLAAVTVRHGLTSTPGARYELPRVRISRGDGDWALATRIRG